MPCDQVRAITVEFGVGTDLDLLTKAAEKLGYRVVRNQETNRLDLFDQYGSWQGVYEAGKLTLDEARINSMKKAYSTQVVESSARRFGWQTKKLEASKYVLQKRGL